MRRFLILQTGRSGSRWISRVLRAAGIRCGHEQVFSVRAGFRGWKALHGDSSWPALHWVLHDPEPVEDALLVHQVRAPLDVINSLTGTNFLRAGDLSPYSQFRRRMVPGLLQDIFQAAMQIWFWTNAVIRELEPAMTWRMEDAGPLHLEEFCRLVGHDMGRQTAQQAFDEWDEPINNHKRSHFTWDDLPAGELRDKCAHLAEELGYDRPTGSYRPETTDDHAR